MKKYEISPEKRAALEGLRQPFAIYQFIDRRVVTILLSDGFCELFGYTDRGEAVRDMDNDMYKDAHPDDVARIADAALRFAKEGGRYEAIYRTRKKDGPDYVVVHAMGEHVYTEDGVRLAQVWYTDEGTYVEDSSTTESEITKTLSNVLHEQSIIRTSQYDYLTGLPNMTYFFVLAAAEKEAILENGGHPMLLYIDFSGMKFFNAKHGFAEGDRMLQAFARLLVRAFSSENCCRIGADHFAVATEETGLEEKLDRLFREFGELNGGKTLPVHVGVYSNTIEDVPVSSACDRAKLACTSLKGTYASAYSYYSAEMREDAMQKQYVIENLDTAIREKWIQVYLQPIIRTVNERVCDVEALARWNDPEKGLLSPARFIPALEEAGLIYKLDLYMVDQVLEAIRTQIADGFYIVPHSINLSRSDFDACDIVEEIRKRVDASGVKRDRITIEITESVIGGDFEFMKEQVERFRKLGFPVWMDDFGSGYSSLDVLQSIRFDVLKFDMSFMRKLDEGENGKIILTELMRMATSLGVDTVCEGVETQAQVRLLREIGCSKVQGYYYSGPIPFEKVREMRKSKSMIENENPEESDYYESIGRANLFDLGVVASGDENALQHTFSTIPIAILEVNDNEARYVRSNRSYQEFVKRVFSVDVLGSVSNFENAPSGHGMNFISAVRQCCDHGSSVFFSEKMPDGTVVHSFVRRINSNPVTGSIAVATAVLSITEADESTTYADIAKALAADYYNIFVIDLDTDDYIEYSSQVGGEELSIERHGEGFFDSARRDTMTRIYEEDREAFLKWFTKENVLRELDTQGVFTTTYRLIDTGTPMYVNMKITRMQGGNRIILGISIIDAQMKQQEEENQLRQEKIALGRIAALSASYIVLYTVDPETGCYTQYSPSDGFENFGLARQGEDFFGDVRRDAPKAIPQSDMERHLRTLTKENMLREIKQKGHFIYNYRILLNGEPVPVCLRAALVEEDGEKIILGVSKVNAEQQADMPEMTFSREACEKAGSAGVIYSHIAQALAHGYTDLYYVNMDTDAFIEFHTDEERGVLTEARRGADFFESCERDAKLFVHPEDQAAFVKTMNRASLTEALDRTKVYELIYRRIKGGDPFYVRMKISRMEDDPRYIVLAVSDIDELMRQRRAELRIQEERMVYARLQAITGNFIVVYVVEPETGFYREFSAIDGFEESFSRAKEGTDFFGEVRDGARLFNHPGDLKSFLSAFTKENVLSEIERSGIFTLGYRLIMDGKPHYVQMKAAMVEEKEGRRLIVGVNDIDAQMRQEEEYGRRLEQAQTKLNIDALTGIKNKRAYLEAEERLDHQIEEHVASPFAVVILDVNDLKKINDTLGHQAGDQYIRAACKIICETFKHSPVFRIGGDEFAVICQGNDYACVEELLEKVKAHNAEAMLSGGVVIACGMSKFNEDACMASVFKRADHSMYENKKALKAARNG